MLNGVGASKKCKICGAELYSVIPNFSQSNSLCVVTNSLVLHLICAPLIHALKYWVGATSFPLFSNIGRLLQHLVKWKLTSYFIFVVVVNTWRGNLSEVIFTLNPIVIWKLRRKILLGWPLFMRKPTQIFINGPWIGVHLPVKVVVILKLFCRRYKNLKASTKSDLCVTPKEKEKESCVRNNIVHNV